MEVVGPKGKWDCGKSSKEEKRGRTWLRRKYDERMRQASTAPSLPFPLANAEWPTSLSQSLPRIISTSQDAPFVAFFLLTMP